MNELEQFHHDFRQEVLTSSDADAGYQLNAFMDEIANRLRDSGAIEGFELCHFRVVPAGIRVDGYWLNEEGVLDLYIADFNHRESLESLPKSDVDTLFKRLTNFVLKSLDRNFTSKLEITSPEYQLTELISNKFDSLHKINFYIFSERSLSRQVQNLDEGGINGVRVNYHIWDTQRLFRLHSSKMLKEPLDIDFEERFGEAIPCLPAYRATTKYQSYLMVMPGNILATLYEDYGTRLLEQNVRSFLQARGKVNKGIRATILNEPDMFFAYNNGITATAESVDCEMTPQGLAVKRMTDLQIVNGGQTTASLFHTRKKDKAKDKLDEVLVQMKLTVISGQESETVVPRISEYANTQNRVNAADFFSNHPFHIRIEQFSRRLWAPAIDGSQHETKWFYERARGQYADAQSTLTPAKKNKFKLEHPKSQMFTKTDLAKFENVWDDHPRWVNQGAQMNFSKYAERIGKEWEKDESEFNELYFKRIIARAIIFKSTEKLVSDQSWYEGGYRANIVAYTIAMLSEILRQRNKWLNELEIWQQQKINSTLELTICIIAKEVYQVLVNPPADQRNVTQWAKKSLMWDKLREKTEEIAAQLPEEFYESLITAAQKKAAEKSAKKLQKMDEGIEAQEKVIQFSAEQWKSLNQELQDRSMLNSKESGIVKIAMQLPAKLPSEKQCVELLKIIDRAVEEGILIENL